ncbi:MAG: hypothetical protein ACU84J_11325 [Gammaproteobacteria bacterium]
MKFNHLTAVTCSVLSFPAFANTCTAFVDGPNQGVHTRFDGSADAVAWPPNHKLRTIEISAENDNGNACNVTITDVKQDELLDGEGDGNTRPDAANCNNAGNVSTIEVRGERSGLGTGRYYTIFYTMDDPDEPLLPAMGEALVLVPHDQGVAHLDTWVNEGPLFNSYDGAVLSCSE